MPVRPPVNPGPPLDPHSRLFIRLGERNPITPLPLLRPKHGWRKEAEDGRKKPASPAGGWHEVMSGLHLPNYWIASMLTKVPVVPTAFGTVIDRKNVVRLSFA